MSLADASPGAPQSGLQEYAVADIINCAKIPENINDDEAAVSRPFASVLTEFRWN